MDSMYLAILVILVFLAVIDLIVGVSNDAANFLNSAIGSRAAKRKYIVAAAAIGVIIGASISSGMMEIARSGVFVPASFTFHEVMLLFLAVMLTDVILLDLFNTFGMPTSTTVSMVFELLGAAVAMAVYKMTTMGDAVSQEMSQYINTAKVLQIITGIFLSVCIAFVAGCIVMWFSRLIFSFRYKKTYSYIGALWCALALTAITYFAVFKGLSKSSVIDTETLALLNENIVLYTCYAWGFWLVFSALMQYVLKFNTLKFTALAGTCALALAFAGNDMVNFIGVFMAAESSYWLATAHVAAGGDLATMTMEGLAEPVKANVLYLLAAGLIMVGALIFSKKARTVSDTEIKLARTNIGKERFGSSLASRMMVRSTINCFRSIKSITPMPVQNFVAKRFKPLDVTEEDGAAFDLIRATVNLTCAALLISVATSLKLPLSTTYVTFMVAMGSSLADRAWGRDSAVYRVTGTLAVIGGWFFTGIAAFSGAFIICSILAYADVIGIIVMVTIVGLLLLRSILSHGKKTPRAVRILNLADNKALHQVGENSALMLSRILSIHRSTIKALLAEDRITLKRLRKKSRNISRSIEYQKEDEVLPSLHNLPAEHAAQGQMLFRLTESTQAIAQSLQSIVNASYEHIDNHHSGLSTEQARDLLAMSAKVRDFYPDICKILESGNFDNMDTVIHQAGDLSDEFADSIQRHLVSSSENLHHIRTSILYLNLLNETRSMIRKSFSLIREQKELFRR